MKTNELIKLLQEADPNNECEVCVDNYPIDKVDRIPYYWDGRIQFIERNENWNPIKGGYRRDIPNKIKIIYDTLEDALIDNPDMELDLTGITYNGKINDRYMSLINEWIKDGKEFKEWKDKNDKAHKNGTTLPSLLSKKDQLKHKFTSFLKKFKLIY